MARLENNVWEAEEALGAFREGAEAPVGATDAEGAPVEVGADPAVGAAFGAELEVGAC